MLALFADAIALLPPAKRWQVTFNTCEIEPFDAVWRAVREDLPQARSWRGSPGVIDLTSSATKGSDSIYARFARGEASALPWQVPASDSAKPSTAVATSSPQSPPAEESSQQAPGPVVHHASETQVPPVAPSSPGDTAPPPPDVPSPPAGPKKRNYLEQVERAALDRDQREHAAPTRSKVLGFAGIAAVVTSLLTLLGGFIAIQLNSELQSRIATFFRPKDQGAVKEVAIADPDVSESLGEIQQAERIRGQMADDRRREQEERDREQKRKQDEQNRLDEDRRMADQLEKQKAQEKALLEKAAKELADKQSAAFVTLCNLGSITQEDLPVENDLGDGVTTPCTICMLDPLHLIELSLALAEPTDNLPEGRPLAAFIKPATDAKFRWTIYSTPSNDLNEGARPIALADVAAQKGKLVLTPSKKSILGNSRFAYLRRSFLLIRAKDPREPNKPAAVVAAIQLTRPSTSRPFEIPLLAGSKVFAIPAPPGITSFGSDGPRPGFPAGVQIQYEIAYAFSNNGQNKAEMYEAIWPDRDPNEPRFFSLLECPQLRREATGVPAIGLTVLFSVGQGCNVRATPSSTPSSALGVVSRYAKHSEESFVKKQNGWSEQLKRQVEQLTKKLGRQTLSQAKSFTEIPAHKASIEVYLATKEPKDTFESWQKRWTEILSPTNSANQARLEDQWKEAFCDVLTDWVTYYTSSQCEEELKRHNFFFMPLTTPAHLVVTSITSKASDGDKKEYRVLLFRSETKDIANDQPARGAENAEKPKESL